MVWHAFGALRAKMHKKMSASAHQQERVDDRCRILRFERGQLFSTPHTHSHTHALNNSHTRDENKHTHTHAHIVNIREACGEFEMPFLPLAALLLLHRLTSFSFCLFTHIFAIRVRVFDSAGQPRNMRPAIRRHTCILYILYECTRIQAYTKNTNVHLIAHTLRAAYNNIHIEHDYIATCERN